MKAVNLMPVEARRGGGGSTGPNTSMILLGGLAALVGMVGTYTMIGNQKDDRAAELAQVQSEAAAAEQQAQVLAPYQRFASISQQRQQTVKQLVETRFDWPGALREIARIVPAGADLLSIDASTSPQSGGGGGSLRGALPAPAFEITGCTGSQDRLAVLMSRLRAVDGVQRVTLENSEKRESTSGGTGASDGDCRRTADSVQFKLTVFFRETSAPVPQAPGGTAAAASTTAPNGGTQ